MQLLSDGPKISALRSVLFLLTLSLPLLTGISECQPQSSDADDDGFSVEDGDCDDADNSVYPGAPEHCNGRDENCMNLDEPYHNYYPDADADGWGYGSTFIRACQAPAGYSSRSGDCDDAAPLRAPLLSEVCNGLDDNCDGVIDNGLAALTYRDADGDGFGDSLKTTCGVATGYVSVKGDCNDARADFRPGAPDTQGDGLDQDCGGLDGAQPTLGFGANSVSSLAEALSQLPAGATLWVGPGTYSAVNLSPVQGAFQLISTHGPEQTVLDAQAAGRVMSLSGTSHDQTLIEGFTFQGGQSAGEDGGALLITDASPTLRRLTFLNSSTMNPNDSNYSGSGGCLALIRSQARLEQLVFQGCSSLPSGSFVDTYFGQGGALVLTDSQVTLSDVTASQNTAIIGGFLYASDSVLDLRTADIHHNYAKSSGSALYVDNGQATVIGATIRNHNYAKGFGRVSGTATFYETRSQISGLNFRDNWGGLGVLGNASSVTDSVFEDNHSIVLGVRDSYSISSSEEGWYYNLIQNNHFINNVSKYSEATMPVHLNGHINVDANTFVGNAHSLGGGILIGALNEPCMSLLSSNLFAFNVGYTIQLGTATQALFSYNNFYNPGFELSPAALNLDSSNSFVEPRLVSYTPNGDSSDDSIRLLPDSPLLRTSDPALLPIGQARTQIGAFGPGALPDPYVRDQDADGLYDGWETQRGLNPSQPDASLDSDADGLNNQSEFLKQLHPKNADSDGDGQSDGLEVSGGSNPLDWYERKGNNGLEHVVASVPGDFDSLQEAVHHIVHSGAVTLTAPVVNANMLLDGKVLQVYAPAGAILDVVTENAVTPVQVRFSRLQLENVEWRSNSSMYYLMFIYYSDVLLQSMTVQNMANVGTILSANQSNLVLEDVTLEGHPTTPGGGIYFNGGSFNFDQLRIRRTWNLGLHILNADLDGELLELDGIMERAPLILGYVDGEIRGSRIVNSRSAYSEGALLMGYGSVTFSNCLFAGNGNSMTANPAISLQGYPNHVLRMNNCIVAYNIPSNLSNFGMGMELHNTVFYNPEGSDNDIGMVALPPPLILEPGFLRYDAAGLPTDYHLALSSPLIDLGGGDADPDGSPTDVGCYGGSTGGRWDRDLDGLPEYFWPGTYADAPAEVNPADWDALDTP